MAYTKDTSYSFLLITPSKADFYISKLDHVDKVLGMTVKTIDKKWKTKFKNLKVKNVAINKESLTAAFLDTVKELYPKVKIHNFHEELSVLRAVKTDAEIKKIRAACKIADDALQSFVDAYSAKKFTTESSVAFHLERYIKEQGAELSFPTIVASKQNAAIPHHITGKNKLKTGTLLIDIGAKRNLYCSDMTRVLAVGKLGKEEKEKWDFLNEVQQKAINMSKEGLSYNELDKATRKNLGKYSSYFFHSLGHGIGVEVHEAPRVSPGSKAKIEQNHVYTIEPGVYFPKKFGFRIEDTIAFQKKPKILTKFPKGLIRL